MSYEEHQLLTIPEDSQVLWKYMDFAKFISLFTKKSLFFSRLTSLSDPWEGCYPEHYYSLKSVDSLTPNLKLSYEARSTFAVCCFHSGERDNEAFWKLYASTQYGLAFKTTVGRVKESLRDEEKSIFISKVNYIDYKKDTIKLENIFYPAIHKRKEFDYEKEIRAIYWESSLFDGAGGVKKPSNPSGVSIAVDLNSLIEEVVISPFSEEWFFETVLEILNGLNSKIRVTKSTLFHPPPVSL